MADFETIAHNWIKPETLTKEFPTASNVTQSVRADGGLTIALSNKNSDGWIQPFNGTIANGIPSGDKIGVILLLPSDGLTPMGGASLNNATLTWLRGSSAGYQHALIVRTDSISSIRLHAPSGGRGLVILRVGVFDAASWEQMQARNIIYFDSGGITTSASDGYTLPPATTTTLGGMMVGDGLTVDVNGRVSTLVRELPVATKDTLGVVKEGKGVDIAADGTLSVGLGKNLNFDENGNIEAPDIQTPDLSDYYTKTESDGRYYTQTESDSKYLTTSDAENKFYTKELANATFQKKGDGSGQDVDLSDYYTKTQSDNRYLLQSDYQPLDETVTIGPGPTYLIIKNSSISLTNGLGHLDISSSSIGMAFGSNSISVSNNGVYANGKKIS